MTECDEKVVSDAEFTFNRRLISRSEMYQKDSLPTFELGSGRIGSVTIFSQCQSNLRFLTNFDAAV